jgi:hypothetical protein
MHTRRILLFTVLLLMTPALAMASTARLEGLGVIPDFVEDYANIFTYPVSIARYPGLVIGELGVYGSYGRGFGATMSLGKDSQYGVMGFMLRENSNFTPIPAVSGTAGSEFDLLWGMNFGKASLGLRFDNSSSKFEEVGVDKFTPLYFWYLTGMADVTPNDMNSTGITVSAGMDVREKDKIEAAFEYRTLTFLVDQILPTPEIKWEDKGNASYGFAGRGFFSLAENISLVPLFGYNKYDYSWQVKGGTPNPDGGDQTLTNMRGGLGCKVDVGSWFMFGLGVSQTEAKVELNYPLAAAASDLRTFDFTSKTMPFMFGCLETQVKDWLTVRFGAKKNLVNEKVELTFVGPGVESVEFETHNGLIPSTIRSMIATSGIGMPVFNEPFTFALGVGLKFGDLDIDATMNGFYPFTGMYWLSGVSEVPFSRISATYHY